MNKYFFLLFDENKGNYLVLYDIKRYIYKVIVNDKIMCFLKRYKFIVNKIIVLFIEFK